MKKYSLIFITLLIGSAVAELPKDTDCASCSYENKGAFSEFGCSNTKGISISNVIVTRFPKEIEERLPVKVTPTKFIHASGKNPKKGEQAFFKNTVGIGSYNAYYSDTSQFEEATFVGSEIVQEKDEASELICLGLVGGLTGAIATQGCPKVPNLYGIITCEVLTIGTATILLEKCKKEFIEIKKPISGTCGIRTH